MTIDPVARALIVVASVALAGCVHQPEQGATNACTVVGMVTALSRADEGRFRFWGEFVVQSPAAYAGKNTHLFVICHDEDVRDLIGTRVSWIMPADEVKRSVEPFPDPFSVSQPVPQFSLESEGHVLRAIDDARYARRVPAQGVIKRYEPETPNGMVYFRYDLMSSGDMAFVEITSPPKYRGVVLHVLVNNYLPAQTAQDRKRWNAVGSTVSFSAAESILAWEPWGFTETQELTNLVTLTAPHEAGNNGR